MATLLDKLLSRNSQTRWMACHEQAKHVGRYFRAAIRDDLVQEATLHLYNNLGGIDVTKDPVPYLDTIAYRCMARATKEYDPRYHLSTDEKE